MQRKAIHVQNGKVFLHLPNVTRKPMRHIGKIDYRTRTFYTSPRRSRIHVMKCNNALGINYDLIKQNRKQIRYICVKLDNNYLWISRKELLKKGQLLEFKSKGLEKQIFLELSQFYKSRKAAKKGVEL